MDLLGSFLTIETSGWVWFGVILLVVCIPVAVGLLWYVWSQSRKPRRKRKHRHHAHHGPPTLAQKGGLPPARPVGQAPPKP